jgi:hypothetical protein
MTPPGGGRRSDEQPARKAAANGAAGGQPVPVGRTDEHDDGRNSGISLSIGVFFSLMIAGLASALPRTLTSGLAQHGVAYHVAAQIGSLPPVSSLFAAKSMPLTTLDPLTDQGPGSHRHSIERVFPRLGETATSAEIIGFLDRRP